jgi:dienelactone hydrolase
VKHLQLSIIIIFLILLSAPSLSAQAIEDPGPHPVGWQDVTFVDQIYSQGTITGRIFYPALSAGHMTDPDPSSGPYPLIGFQHGWLGQPSDYDKLCTHMAGWGFVVASTGTETGYYLDPIEFAKDTRSFLHWVDNESGDPVSWLYGMAWAGDWAATGHSMGGGTLALLIGYEPRVKTIIGLQPYLVGGASIPNMKAFEGCAFQVAGGVDKIAPPSMAHSLFENAISAERNIYFLVEGMGHMGPTDNPPNNEPLSGPEQARMHRKLVTGLFRAEVKGEEDLYADLLGEGMEVEPVLRESDCEKPPFWSRMSAYQTNGLVTGLGGRDGDAGLLALSLAPASIPTAYGILEINPIGLYIFYADNLPAEGFSETLLQLPQAASGVTIYLQGAVGRDPGIGMLTRSVEVVVP